MKAPFDGVITARFADPGSLATANTTRLLEVTDLSTLELAQQFRSAQAHSQISPQTQLMQLQSGSRDNTSAWVSAYTGKSAAGADTDLGNRTHTLATQAAGIEWGIPEQSHIRTGISVGKLRQNTQSTPFQGQQDTVMATLYSVMQLGEQRLDMYAFSGKGDLLQSRSIELPDQSARTAKSTATTDHYGLGSRLQWQNADHTLNPFVGVSALWHRTAPYSETQAQAANMIVSTQRSNSQHLELGFTLQSGKNPSIGSWTWLMELSSTLSRMQSGDTTQRLQDTNTDFIAQGQQRSGARVKALLAAAFPLDRNSIIQMSGNASSGQGESRQGLQISYRLAW